MPDLGEREMRLRRIEMLYDRETGGYEDDEAFAARYVGQESLEGPSMTAGLRAEMAFWGDTEEERRAVFEAVRPEGQMMEVPGTELVVFRESPDEQWRKADKGLIESITRDSFLRETGRDLAEFGAGEGPEMLGEALAMMGGKAKVPAAGRAVKNLFRLMLGNIMGGAAQEAVQQVRGTARETAGEVTRRKTMEAIGTGVGAGVGGLAAGTFSAIGRRSHGALVGAVPTAREAVAASERVFPKVPKDPRWYHFGKPKYSQMSIPVNYLTDQPLIQRVGRIAAAIMPWMNRYIQKVDMKAKSFARAMVNPTARDAFMRRAAKDLDDSTQKIIDFTSNAVKFKSVHPRQQGRTIQNMIDRWWEASRMDVDALYAVARSLYDPDFNLSPVLKDADTLLARTVTPGKPVATGRIIGRGGAEEITTPLVRFGRAPTERLRDFIGRLKAIDEGLPTPDLPDGVPIPSKTDRIRAMIQELDDMGQPGLAGEREADLLAKRLSAQLREVLENPIGGDREFSAAWKRASRAARRRFQTREQLVVIDAVNTQTPSSIVHKLILANPKHPQMIDNLIAMRKATGKDGWDMIRSAFKERVLGMMRDPDDLGRFLDDFQPQAKRMLLDPAEERVIRTQAGKIRQLYKSGLREAAESQTRHRAFVKQLIDTDSTAAIDALIAFVNDRGGALQSSFQHALMDEAIERSMVYTKEGVQRISGKAMNKTLENFREKGLLGVLHGTQVLKLQDVKAIQTLMDRAVEDAGTSLTGAATAKGFFSGSLSAIGTALHMIGLSKILTTPGMTRFLIGTGEVGPGAYSTRRAALMIGAIATHLMSDVKKSSGMDKDFEDLQKVVSLVSPTQTQISEEIRE
jgi:hypothetical protein